MEEVCLEGFLSGSFRQPSDRNPLELFSRKAFLTESLSHQEGSILKHCKSCGTSIALWLFGDYSVLV